MWWGLTEIWNADQMAFKDHFREGALPFSPTMFYKPPLMSYMNFVFSVVPREVVVRIAGYVSGDNYDGRLDFLSVWLAKILQLLLACSTVYLLWRVVADFAGRRQAAISSLLLASAAGFIVQAHLITTDLPVVFFMMLAFWASQRIYHHRQVRDYVLAGICIGLTGAMKYNGVVVGLALPIFHYYATEGSGFLSQAFDRRFVLGLLSVPFGFLLGNPFAAIEFNRFVADLNYVFTVAAPYVGARSEESREANLFVTLATDHVGWPLFIVLTLGLILGIFAVIRGGRSCRTATLAAAIGIGAVYTTYFLIQTNVMVRWILPLVPLLLITAVPLWERIAADKHPALWTIPMALVVYGIVCSVNVGLRFAADPRIDAVKFVAQEVPAGATIESTTYVPDWNRHRGIQVNDVLMPSVSGRRRVFEDVLRDRPEILAMARRQETEDLTWYTIPELESRNPEYIAISSIYFDRFLDGSVADYYPELCIFFVSVESELWLRDRVRQIMRGRQRVPLPARDSLSRQSNRNPEESGDRDVRMTCLGSRCGSVREDLPDAPAWETKEAP